MSLSHNAGFKIVAMLILFFAIFAGGTAYYIYELSRDNEIIAFTEPEPIPVMEYGLPVDSFMVSRGTVKNGENISMLLNSFKVSPGVIDKLVNSSDDVFDLRKIKSGKKYTAFCSKKDSCLQHFVYEHSPAEFIMFNLKDSIHVSKEEKEVIAREISASASIQSSLWKAMDENDINVEVAVKLSEIYAWTIDFFDLKKNDGFKVIYEEHFADSISLGVKKIIGACFHHKGKNYYAFPFTVNGVLAYFDENGNSLKKAFLKAPLKFSRITSKFTNARFHPVLKKYTTHFGVDYAAPVGTPVYCIGAGTVIMCAYDKGAGNIIKINHSGGYVSTYMHLSGFGEGIHNGSRVSQGQVIGFVGSTGLSTGPHLDFRVHKNGKPLDPLKIVSPPEEPINKSQRPQFDKVKSKVLKQIEKLNIN